MRVISTLSATARVGFWLFAFGVLLGLVLGLQV
jgi:hypothetical protein